MKHFIIIIALISTLFSAPIPLRDNSATIFNSDSLFNITVDRNNAFWKLQNFSFQAVNRFYVSDDSTLSGNRLLLMISDSLHYKFIDLVFAGFFDQQGIYGENIGWTDPDLGKDFTPKKSFDLYKGYIAFHPTKWMTFKIGKDYYNWGPLQLGGLLLSNYNVGFVSFYQEYNVGPFSIKGLSTQLNSTPWGAGTVEKADSIVNRFYAASRVEFYRERYGFALEQAAIYAGVGRSFEIPYFIPIFPFHYAQMSNWRYGNNGDNSYGGIDFYVNWLEKQLKLYGELLIDDIQGETDDVSQSVQNNIGFMAGVNWDFNKIYGFFEGGQINSFVYNHISGYDLRYQNLTGMIGSPLGPDNQLFWGNIGYRIRPFISVDVTSWYRRMGERDITYEYSTVHGTRDDPIPYGIVTNEFSNWLTIKGSWKGISAELNGGYTSTKNIDHIEDNNVGNYFVGLKVKSGLNLNWKQ